MRDLKLLLLVVLLAFVSGEVQAAETSDPPALAPSSLYQPEALRRGLSASDLLGGGSGYVHPFLSVGEFFTDNLFNTPYDEKSEFVTVISPGLWIAVPASRQPLAEIDTLNSAPGGLDVTRFRPQEERRFQGYALYRADIREHRNFPDEETTNHRAEGSLQAHLRGGLSLELLDLYQQNYESYATGISRRRELDTFASNFLQFSAAYRFSPKLELEADYSIFTLNFDDTVNEFRERDDHALSATLFYRLLPKTSVVLRYAYADIDYDQPVLSDSREHRFYGGVQWIPNARSRARLLLGHGEKEFLGPESGSRGDFIGEAQFRLAFSPRATFNLQAVRRTHETDIPGTRDILSHRVQAEYLWRMTERLSAGAELSYVRDSYRGEFVFGRNEGKRKDNYYGAGLTLGYAFRRWLSASLGYSYVERRSNFDTFDYRSRNVFLKLTAAL